MILFMKPLPPTEIDTAVYRPFIHNELFRERFMLFVYALQISLAVVSAFLGVWRFAWLPTSAAIFAAVFLVHELLHISVVYKAGDISLTHSGIFFWLTLDAELSKARYLLFMALPLTALTLLPAAAMLFCSGRLYELLRFIAWANAIIAGADIINTALIIIKPRGSVFFRGYYKCVGAD